jgi:hypothetical protein
MGQTRHRRNRKGGRSRRNRRVQRGGELSQTEANAVVTNLRTVDNLDLVKTQLKEALAEAGVPVTAGTPKANLIDAINTFDDLKNFDSHYSRDFTDPVEREALESVLAPIFTGLLNAKDALVHKQDIGYVTKFGTNAAIKDRMKKNLDYLKDLINTNPIAANIVHQYLPEHTEGVGLNAKKYFDDFSLKHLIELDKVKKNVQSHTIKKKQQLHDTTSITYDIDPHVDICAISAFPAFITKKSTWTNPGEAPEEWKDNEAREWVTFHTPIFRPLTARRSTSFCGPTLSRPRINMPWVQPNHLVAICRHFKISFTFRVLPHYECKPAQNEIWLTKVANALEGVLDKDRKLITPLNAAVNAAAAGKAAASAAASAGAAGAALDTAAAAAAAASTPAAQPYINWPKFEYGKLDLYKRGITGTLLDNVPDKFVAGYNAKDEAAKILRMYESSRSGNGGGNGGPSDKNMNYIVKNSVGPGNMLFFPSEEYTPKMLPQKIFNKATGKVNRTSPADAVNDEQIIGFGQFGANKGLDKSDKDNYIGLYSNGTTLPGKPVPSYISKIPLTPGQFELLQMIIENDQRDAAGNPIKALFNNLFPSTIISKDGYIIDGHHGWSKAKAYQALIDRAYIAQGKHRGSGFAPKKADSFIRNVSYAASEMENIPVVHLYVTQVDMNAVDLLELLTPLETKKFKTA